MAIRSDSFSSVDEVRGYTRHLLDGHPTFDTLTRPTLTEVEKFIDRASALLNNCISAKGFTPSTIYANSTAKLACDDWVTQQATRYVELTQPGAGYEGGEGNKSRAFNMQDLACDFISALEPGWVNAGITQSISLSRGLQYTGLDVQSNRDDPTDDTKEQPLFSRRNFDNK